MKTPSYSRERSFSSLFQCISGNEKAISDSIVHKFFVVEFVSVTSVLHCFCRDVNIVCVKFTEESLHTVEFDVAADEATLILRTCVHKRLSKVWI